MTEKLSKPEKKSTSHRFSDEAKRLLPLLAQQGGISQTAVLETLIRKEAKRLKIK